MFCVGGQEASVSEFADEGGRWCDAVLWEKEMPVLLLVFDGSLEEFVEGEAFEHVCDDDGGACLEFVGDVLVGDPVEDGG